MRRGILLPLLMIVTMTMDCGYLPPGSGCERGGCEMQEIVGEIW